MFVLATWVLSTENSTHPNIFTQLLLSETICLASIPLCYTVTKYSFIAVNMSAVADDKSICLPAAPNKKAIFYCRCTHSHARPASTNCNNSPASVISVCFCRIKDLHSSCNTQFPCVVHSVKKCTTLWLLCRKKLHFWVEFFNSFLWLGVKMPQKNAVMYTNVIAKFAKRNKNAK